DPTRVPGRGAAGARQADRRCGPRRLAPHVGRRGVRPRGSPGQRRRTALRPRGQSLPRPLEQRRPGPDGPRLRLDLPGPRPADRGRGAHALPEPPRRRRPGQRGVCRVSGTLTLVSLRNLSAADRGRIEEITRATGVFREDEVPVALEVFDGAVAGSPDYIALGA